MRLKNVIDFASKPRWLYSIAARQAPFLGQHRGSYLTGAQDLNSTAGSQYHNRRSSIPA